MTEPHLPPPVGGQHRILLKIARYAEGSMNYFAVIPETMEGQLLARLGRLLQCSIAAAICGGADLVCHRDPVARYRRRPGSRRTVRMI